MRPFSYCRRISRVIAVSGAAVSGKSTIVKGIGRPIPDTLVIYFDRYPVQMPEDLPVWLGNGADFNQWSAPGLADDLVRARDGGELVVFEAPLGRRHELTGAHIDFLVFIEIPLEIALA